MHSRESGDGIRAHNRLVLREVPRDTVIPAWVLPLMRLVRARPDKNLARVWAELPRTLPPGVAPPSIEDAAIMLLRLGLA